MKRRQRHLLKLQLVKRSTPIIYSNEARKRVLVHIFHMKRWLIEMLVVKSSIVGHSLHKWVMALYYWCKEWWFCDIVNLRFVRKEPGGGRTFLLVCLLTFTSPGAISRSHLAALVNGLNIGAVHKEMLCTLLLFTGSCDLDFAVRLSGPLRCWLASILAFRLFLGFPDHGLWYSSDFVVLERSSWID